MPGVSQVAQPVSFFEKVACINARQLACTSARQPHGGWCGGRFDDGITVGGEGRRIEGATEWVEVWLDGFGGSEGLCGGCGYEERTLEVERVVAGGEERSNSVAWPYSRMNWWQLALPSFGVSVAVLTDLT